MAVDIRSSRIQFREGERLHEFLSGYDIRVWMQSARQNACCLPGSYSISDGIFLKIIHSDGTDIPPFVLDVLRMLVNSGRQVLPPRFLRHAPLLLVDSPAEESLRQIYGAFNAALLKLHPPLRGHLDGLTNAMIELYRLNQVKSSKA